MTTCFSVRALWGPSYSRHGGVRMLERLTTTFAGRNIGNVAAVPPVTEMHLRWMQNLLAESPASLQSIPLGQLDCGEVTMEWQAVFQGAGVVYVRCQGSIIAAGMLLQGKFLTSEHAAIEAVQQTLLSGRGRSAGFEMVRRQHARPLRAIVVLDETIAEDLLVCLQYWIDCLASAYFPTLPEMPDKAAVQVAEESYPAQAP